MATGTLPKPDQNPGQRESDDLFNHFENQFQNPTGSSVDEDSAIGRANDADATDRAKPGIPESQARAAKGQREMERRATMIGGGTQGTLADQEAGTRLNKDDNFYKKSEPLLKKVMQRRVFIGLGAGGGILSLIAGLGFLTPFKMFGIMNTLIGDAGERLEKIVERRAEKVFYKYVLKGSKAAATNGNLVADKSPSGILFKHMRESGFELELKETFELEFEPGPNKSIRLKHKGVVLGDVHKTQDIIDIINADNTFSKDIVRQIIKSTRVWPFYKRTEFVDWLKRKYKILRFGAREKQATETEEAYNKSVMEEHIEQLTAPGFENALDLVDCIAKSGDCPETDKTGSARDFYERSKKAISETSKELVQKGTDKLNQLLVKAAIPKILATSVGAAIPYVGEVDLAMRFMYGFGNEVEKGVFQKKRASYIAKSSAVVGAVYAGLADQSVAGDLPASTVGMFSDRFTGWEASAAYGLINDGELRGEKLDSAERANESVTLPEFANIMKNIVGVVAWPGFQFAGLWVNSVSKALDFAGEIAGTPMQWIIEHTPARALIDNLTPYLADIFEALLKFVGLTIDPLAVGAKLTMYVHQGFLASFNGMSKEMGMRKLTPEQARLADAELRQEQLAERSNMSFYDRLFNLGNPESLVTKISMVTPGTSSSPVLALATGTTRLVANTPNNLSRLSSGTAYAAAPIASEELYAIDMYGETAADAAAELHYSVEATEPVTCPENRDDFFNHCKFDPSLFEAVDCTIVKCAAMKPGAYGEFDDVFAGADRNYSDNPFNSFSRLFDNLVSPVIPAATKRERSV